MDLIEKQHPAVCRLKRPRFIALRTGKRAFDVAKQVGGQQLGLLAYCAQLKLTKGASGASSPGDGELMHQLSHIAFAGPAIAGNKQR